MVSGSHFFPEGAIVVGEVNASLGGDVAEGDGLGSGCYTERKDN